MNNLFTKHPHSIGESYWQHLGFALYFGGKMVLGGLACMVHAFLPFLFMQSGSNTVNSLKDKFLKRTQKARNLT